MTGISEVTAAESALIDYRRVRSFTESLAAPLSPEDCTPQSMTEASPVKWQLAHTTWFFETFVLEGRPGFAPFNPDYRVLFNSYYNSVGDKHPRPQRGLLTRPSLEEVLEYRRHVDERMHQVLQEDPAEDLAAVVRLGINHEQQHQELILTDVKHLLSQNFTRPVYRADLQTREGSAADPRWIAHPGGLTTVGHRAGGFAFDNEGPPHQVFLNPFSVASRPATCGEYLEFMADGGYAAPELWLDEGWAMVQAQKLEAPLYWFEQDGSWFEFTLGGVRPVNLHAPVCHVSLYEADAFASWAGKRLPTEHEWEAAFHDHPVEGLFADTPALHPQGIDGSDLSPFGSVWEWTRSAYSPYPGFKAAQGALGEYNGKFMSSQFVLRGGSCATPAGHVRATYRNFFHPGFRWQFSGLRLAQDG